MSAFYFLKLIFLKAFSIVKRYREIRNIMAEANLIFPIKWEYDNFDNIKDLQWYMKFLFSCSKDHKANSKTELNSYLRRDLETGRLSKFGFMTQNQQKYEQFKEGFWEIVKDHKKIIYETHHCAFLISVGNKLITNLVMKSPENERELITTIPNKMLDSIIETYYQDNEELLFAKLDFIINDPTKELIQFADAPQDIRKIVEKKMHGTINQNEPRDVLISVSMHDIENKPYQIQRLIKI